MYPAPFEYHTPGSVQDAVALLARYQDEAKLLAGGHSLLPIMKLRFAQPKHLIDLRRIPGMSGISEWQDSIAVGALTTHRDVESSEVLRAVLRQFDNEEYGGAPLLGVNGNVLIGHGGSSARAIEKLILVAVEVRLPAVDRGQ